MPINRIVKKYGEIALFLALSLLVSCGIQIETDYAPAKIVSGKPSPITGSVPSLVGSISSVKHNNFYAYAATCQAFVDLYVIDGDGNKVGETITRAEVLPDGTFELNVDPNTMIQKNLLHMLEVVTEGTCDVTLQRPLTKPETKQVITPFSTVVSFSATANLVTKFTEVDKVDMEKLLDGTDSVSTPQDAYQELSTIKASEFYRIFSDNFDKLLVAPPLMKDKALPSLTSLEGVAQNLRISAFHWSPDYQMAVQWKMDGQVVGQGLNLNYRPSANSSGAKNLEVYIGADDGFGNVDVTKAYHYIPYSFSISNNILPSPPALDFTNSVVGTNNITVKILTGASKVNCQSFSAMAATVDDATIPLAFLIDCDSPNSQDLQLTLPSGDGNKIIRLWAIDHEGVVSALPSSLTVTLEQTPPVLALTVPAKVNGNTPVSLFLSASDTSGVSSFKIYASTDAGVTYTLLQNLSTSATTYSWNPSGLNTSSARIKIEATDSLGNMSSLESSNVTIDSTAPSALTLTRTSAAIAETSATVTINTCTDTSKVLIKLNNTAPLANDAAWVSCSTASSYTVSLTAEGSNSIYGFAMDDVGNISGVSVAATVTRDQTPPTVSLLSPTGAIYVKGGANQTITWSASDSNLVATPISIDYSDDGGSTWTTIVSSIANSGSYSWAVPTINTAATRLRIKAVDSLSHQTIAASTQNFVIDSTIPIISSFTLNNGSATAATAFLTAKIVGSDTSGITHMRLSLNSAFADTNWETFNSSNFTYQVPFASGTRIVYVWIKDAAGNISNSVSATISVSIGAPPVATLTAPNGSVNYATSPQDIDIQWVVTSTVGLMATNPISLTYASVDNTVTGTISTTLSNGANSGCTVESGNTGCTTWTFPATLIGKSFKFSIKALDLNGSSVITEGPLLNGSGLRLFAGKNSAALDQSSLAVALNLSPTFRAELAIDTSGSIYYSAYYSIFKFDSKTGNVDRWMGNGTPGNTGNGSAPSKSSLVQNGTLAADHLGNVYFYQNGGTIRRFNASTGLIEVYSGAGAQPPSVGLNRSLLAAGYISNTFTIDPQGRLYFPIVELQDTTGGCNRYAISLWRIGLDDKLELIAGDRSRTNIIEDQDSRNSGLGEIAQGTCTPVVQGNNGGALTFRAADATSSSDVLYWMAPTHGIKLYAIRMDNNVISRIFNWGTNLHQIAWDPVRGRIIAPNPSYVMAINPNLVQSSASLGTLEPTKYAQAVTVDKNGGIYYSTNAVQRIFYIDPISSTHSTFAGVLPSAGSGVPATSAELRSPYQAQLATDGSVYFLDTSNSMIRKIASDGNISAIRSTTNICGTISGNTLMSVIKDDKVVMIDGWAPCLVEAISNTKWGFYGSTSNPRDAVDGSLIDGFASTGTIVPGTSPYVTQQLMAYDPVTQKTFMIFKETGSGTAPIPDATFMIEVRTDKTIYRRLGSNARNITHSPTGTPVSSAEIRINISGTVTHGRLQVYNNVAYIQKDQSNSIVQSYPTTGNVGLESAATGASLTVDSFYIDGANGKMFWMRGNTLYTKPLGSEGTVQIATFPYPLIIQSRGYAANSLLFTYGNGIYEYTNATYIP